MNENNSRKKIQFPWKAFLIGVLLSIITFSLLKKYNNAELFIKDFTLCFIGLILIIGLTLKKLGLVEINKQGYIGSPPKIIVLFLRLVTMLVGHGLGFITFMLFYQFFRK